MAQTAGTKRQDPLPRITFVDAKATPTAAALIVTQMIERLGLLPLVSELGMEKESGVEVEHVILVFLLMASYGATSVAALAQRVQQDTSLQAIVGGVKQITDRVLGYYPPQQTELKHR
jgi:hypothetical protein